MNNLYEILITIGSIVIVIILVTIIFKYRLKDRLPEGAEKNIESKLAELSQLMSDIRDKQMQVPTAIAEGQLKGYQSVQEQFTRVIESLQNHLSNVAKQLTEGQSETGKILDRKLEGTINAVNKQLNDIMRTLNEQLSATQGNINKNLETTSKVVTEVSEKLGSLSETAKEIETIGKDIGKLQDLLSIPKFRGNIGEILLENLLREIIPNENFEVQYRFKNNTQVDAVIKLAGGIIPIDSKFPLESFNRMRNSEDDNRKKYAKEFINSVKNRIDEIASKYINPKEGTFDFALMYIPAENVYYEMMIGSDIEDFGKIRDYAQEKKVFPVSPNTLYTYLIVISIGLRGMKVEKNAERILENLSEIQKLYERFEYSYSALGKGLNNLMKKYEEAEKYSNKIAFKLESLTGREFSEVEEVIGLNNDKVIEDGNKE